MVFLQISLVVSLFIMRAYWKRKMLTLFIKPTMLFTFHTYTTFTYHYTEIKIIYYESL